MGHEMLMYLQMGVTVVAFIGNAMYVKGVFGTKIAGHDERLNKMESTVVYRDTCKATHIDVGHRLDRVETSMNGALKKKEA